jgi:hypothetical protein
MKISAEQCASLLGEALRNRPQDIYSDTALEWFADVAGIVAAHDQMKAMQLQLLIPRISDVGSGALSPVTATMRQSSCTEFITKTRSIYTELRLLTNSFVTAQMGKGQVFDYFDEVRRIIAGATQDILFIDPYIDPDFVARYLPQIPAGVNVRLLTAERQIGALAPAVKLFLNQYSGSVELRHLLNKSLHDRHLIVDRRDVYQSGASFKDGARNAPTSINQIVDVASQMITAHEQNWASAIQTP